MPDIFDDLKQLGINVPNSTTNTATIDNSNTPSQGSIELFKTMGLDKLLGSTETSGATNTGISNPNFDPNRTEFNKELSNSWFDNAYNTFRNAINETNINTQIGKLNYSAGEFGQGIITGANLGAEGIIDNYDTDLKKLENARNKGILSDTDYTEQLNTLNLNYSKAQQDYQKGLDYIAQQNANKDSRVVSKSYQTATQRVQQKGDDAGFIETLQYAAPQTLGSSASLMVPQLVATFGSNLTKALIKSSAAYILGPEAGVPANIIGTVGAIGLSIAELTWGRAQESYGEIGSTIQDARDKMIGDYMQKNNLQDISQVPVEVMHNIRVQSRKGADIQFKENMALVAQDIPAALLMPMNTLGATLGIGKAFGKIAGSAEELLTNAKNYNILTKGLYATAGLRANMLSEQFEEGYQYAAQKRAENSIYGLDDYQNKGLISSVLNDAYNTAASLNYTLVPGLTPSLRGDGKYSLDSEFQNSDNSGAFLSLLMGGSAGTLGAIREIQGYKKSKQDVIRQGLFDVDSKTERLNADLLKSYFAKGQTERLVTAIRAVADKKDENGNVFYNAETGNEVIRNIRDTYKVYQGITDHLDNMPKRGLLGLFNSKEQNSMRSLYESDALTVALNLKRQNEIRDGLEANKVDVLNDEYRAGDNVQTNEYKDLLAKKEALEGLIDIHNNESELSKLAPKGIKENLQKELESVNANIELELQLLKDSGYDTSTISQPSRNLVSVNNSIYVNREYNKSQRDIYNELNAVKTEQDLINYYNKNKDRTNLQDVVENVKGETVDNVANTRTPSEIITDTTEGYNPAPEAQIPSGVTSGDITGLPTIDENAAPVEAPVSTVPGPGSLGLNTEIDTSQMSTAVRNGLLKTGLNTILSVPDISQKDSEEALKFGGLDIKNTPIGSIVSKLKEILSPEEIIANADKLKTLIATSKGINPNDVVLTVDATTQVVHQYNGSTIDDENKKVEKDFKDKLESNPTKGYKIYNSLSIANRNVGFESREDSYDENGKLIFNTINPESQLVNTNLIQVGQEVTISLANPEILDSINLNDDAINSIGKNTDIDSSENPLDNVELLITTIIDNKVVPLGYIHKIGYITNSSFDNPSVSIIEARQELRQQRLNLVRILKDNPSATFTSSIIDKGFGHLSLNEKSTFTTVKNSIGEDVRPYLTVTNEVGLPVMRDGKLTYSNISPLAPGASIMMIPNEINGSTQYIPIYLTKQTLSNDARALSEVSKGLQEFLLGADNTWGSGIDQWVYTSINSKSDARKLGLNGIGLSNEENTGSKTITVNNTKYSYNRNTQIYQIQGITGPFQTVSQEEFYNGTTRDGLNLTGLNQDIGNIYPSLNKSMLENSMTGKNYQNKMMNSPLYRTRVAQNSTLANLNNSSLEQGQQYQYFAQHTVVLDSAIAHNQSQEDFYETFKDKIEENNLANKEAEADAFDERTELEAKLEGLKKLSTLGINKTSEIAEVQYQLDNLSKKNSATRIDIENKRKEELFTRPDLVVGVTYNIKPNWSDEFHEETVFAKSKDNRAILTGETKDKARWVNLKDFRGDTIRISNSEAAKINAKYDAMLVSLNNPNQINTEEDLDNALGELGLDLPDDINYDIDIDTNQVSNNESLFIDKDNIPYSVQTDILNSISYLLLNSEYTEEISNSDKIKKLFNDKLDGYKSVLSKITESKFPVQFAQITNLVKYYQSSLDNWDKVIEMSNKSLEKIGFISNEQNDYYDNLETNLENIEETEGVQFDDDSSRTRDAREFIPSDVKKLLYFVSATRQLDESNPKDIEITKANGKDYTSTTNSLGLPGFNNFTDTWSKLLNIVSEKEFPSDRATGWPKLIQVLSDVSNPAAVRELANKIQKVPSNVQNGFFTTIVLQRQNNLKTRITISDTGAKTTSIIAADRSTTINNFVNVMKSSFLDNSNIITTSTDQIGRQVKIVNTKVGKELSEQSQAILDNENSYDNAYKKKVFTKQAIESLHKIVQKVFPDISLSGFESILKYNEIQNVKDPVSNYKSIFQSKIFSTLSGNGNSDAELAINQNNPFINDDTQIKIIAAHESKFKTQLQHGGVREGKKTYFPFTKPSFISEIFGNIVEFVKDKLNKGVYSAIRKIDKFANTSQVIENTINGVLNGFGLNYELGSSLVGKNTESKMLKEMTPREHQITKFINYQNSGNKLAYFFYDTLSDKSTMPLIGLNRTDISYSKGGLVDNGTIQLSDQTLDVLMRYINAEYGRILEVQEQNSTLPRIEQIKGYHGSNGMGTKFLIYSFINKPMLDISNPDLSKLMFEQDGTLLPSTDKIISGIKVELNKHYNELFQSNKEDARNLGIFEMGYNGANFNATITDLVDMNYLLRGGKDSIATKLGLTANPNWAQFKATGNANYLGEVDTNKLIDFVIADYVVNYSIKTNEMLQLTGDPAQMGKIDSSDVNDISSTMGSIKAKYKDVPNGELLTTREILQTNINTTLTNVSKRNAAFMGSGGKGLFVSPDYNVSVAKDISINDKDSKIVEYYKSLFPGRESDITKAYENGDMADAQEFTTVREKLTVMEAFAKISREQMLAGIYKYDKKDFDRMVAKGDVEYINFAKKVTPAMLENLGEIIMQPDKPVQRMGVLDSKLGITKQYYIKTSSFPLIPSMVEGTPLQALLEDMQNNDVDRVSFASGVKLGVSLSGPSLFNNDGEYNTNFFKGNIHKLNRDGFRIQLEVPYDPGKNKITEGTQQAKMIFVDVIDNMLFNGRSGRVLKDNYHQLHQEIFDIKLKQFLDEVGAIEENGTYRFTKLDKLSQVLQREAIDRGYSLNSILGLELNAQGKFKIPLTFNPTIGKIEPVITALITNRITRSKLPGHSYVQGSEFILKTGKKGKIKSGEDLEEVLHTEDKRNILWTKPEYANTNKLGYLRKEDGTIKAAQLLMTPHISIGGSKINVSDYTIDVDGKSYLDTSRIDPTLLETNGFRIPFQGHNSGMWFEIIGFLPESCGDLIIVPGEIAAQMGSDYDVDKLYTYQFNYYQDGDNIKKVIDSTTIEDVNKEIAYKNRLVKAELSKLVKSELSVNKLLNDFITDEDLKLDIDERLLGDSLMKTALINLNIDSSELKYISEQDLDIKKKQNSIIEIHKDIYTGNEELFTSILNPLSFDLINQAINETSKFSPIQESKPQFIHDPLYQRDVYFSNNNGGFGTAVSALANTAHAQSQETSLFIKGDGFRVSDALGKIFSDNGNTNRTNSLTDDLYIYKSGEDIINQNGTNSAWRLDKVNTFPDAQGRTFKISDLISQVLGVSVDNAKEQVLAKFGLNKVNFNTGLTVIRLGFDLATTKKIITQPILVELNKRLASLEDMYKTDYTADKKNSTIRNLIDEVANQFKLNSNYKSVNFLARESINPMNISELESSLTDGIVNESNAIQQLEVLKSWLNLTDISNQLQAIQSAYNVDSAGMPKNLSDTLTKRNRINEVIDNRFVGNVDRYAQYSLSGVYKSAPQLAVDLYLNQNDPLLNYNTPGYTSIFNSILGATGREQFFSNQKDVVNNNIKQFIYSNFLNYKGSLDTIKEDLFISNPIADRYDALSKKYPRDKFLGSINKVSTVFANDPVTLEIAVSSEDNYVQEVSEAWLYAYLQTNDESLKQFAIDFFRYTLAVSPQEYGSSSIVRYIPFQIMEDEGFLEYLNNTNEDLNIYGGIDNLTQQFLQHNIDFALSVKQNMIVKGSEVKFNPSDKTWGVQSFKLSNPNLENNKAQGIRRLDPITGEYYYPTYVSFFSNSETGKRLYRLSQDESGSTYEILPSLGQTNISEYDNSKVNQTSMFIDNRVQANLRVDSGALLEQFNISSTDNSSVSSTITMPQLISESKTPGEILTGLNEIMSRYEYNSNKYNQKLGTYYNLIIDKLQSQNYEGVNIQFVNEGNSSTTITGNNIIINKKRALSNTNKANLNSELNTTRVILHELLHSAIFRSNRNTSEYKQIENVYNEYRDTIFRSKETIRGVNSQTLTGEIFSQLVQNLKLQNQDLDINTIQDSSNLTGEAIRGLLQQVSKRMIQLAKDNKISPNLALYDFTNPAREGDFIKFVRDTFKKENVAGLINEYYPYSDINEFITEVSTNPETQKIFKELPSIFQKFKKAITNLLAKIFGYEAIDQNRTLFNDAIDAVFNFISPEDIENNNVSLYEQPNTTIEEQDNNINPATGLEYEDHVPFDIDILDNIDPKYNEEVDLIFEEVPELSNIGTQEQYKSYLSNIFPNSQVKEILYHGGNAGIEVFDHNRLGEKTNASSAMLGFFFSNNKAVSKSYIEQDFTKSTGELDRLIKEYNIKYQEIDNLLNQSSEDLKRIIVELKSIITRILDIIKKLLNSNYVTINERYRNKLNEFQKLTEDYNKLVSQGGPKSIPYFDMYEVISEVIENKQLYSVLLNIENPLIVNRDDHDNELFYTANIKKSIALGNDSTILKNVIDPGKDVIKIEVLNENTNKIERIIDKKGTLYEDAYIGNDYIVFDNSQIHILGSKQDISGFRQWKENNIINESDIQDLPCA